MRDRAQRDREQGSWWVDLKRPAFARAVSARHSRRQRDERVEAAAIRAYVRKHGITRGPRPVCIDEPAIVQELLRVR